MNMRKIEASELDNEEESSLKGDECGITETTKQQNIFFISQTLPLKVISSQMESACNQNSQWPKHSFKIDNMYTFLYLVVTFSPRDRLDSEVTAPGHLS